MIKIENPSISGRNLTVLSTGVLGWTNSIYIDDNKVEMYLTGWYERVPLYEINEGIDQLIELLTAAKAEIAKRRWPTDPPPVDLSWLNSPNSE